MIKDNTKLAKEFLKSKLVSQLIGEGNMQHYFTPNFEKELMREIMRGIKKIPKKEKEAIIDHIYHSQLL